jgi:hypothetical protein
MCICQFYYWSSELRAAQIRREIVRRGNDHYFQYSRKHKHRDLLIDYLLAIEWHKLFLNRKHERMEMPLMATYTINAK